jgi:hypothetical protein
MTDPVIDLRQAFAIVERAGAAHSAALKGVNLITNYHEYRRIRDAADIALELAVVQIGAVIQPHGYCTSFKLASIRSTSTSGLGGAVRNWLNAARKKLAALQDNCPGHVASYADPKICGRCGIHIDELRPGGDELWNPTRKGKLEAHTGTVDPFNPHGSGPVPIEPREG